MLSPEYKLTRHRKLGELLLESNVLTQEQLDQALSVQRERRQRLGQALTTLGFVSEEQIAMVLAYQLNLPLVDLNQHEPNPVAIELVPRELAQLYSVFPLKVEGHDLTLVMVDPLNIKAEDAIRTATGLDIRPAVAPESQILDYIHKYFAEEETVYELLEASMPEPDEGDEVIAIEESTANPKELLEASGFDAVIRAVNAILSDAVKRGASDIHFEPYENQIRVRFRLDGRLRQMAALPVATYPAVVSRIKVLTNLDIAESRKSQDGSFKAFVGKKSISFRVSTLRTGFGEKVVIRLLDNSMRKVGLEAVGLRETDRVRLENLLQQPQGILLVTGPTGSGKTSTLYAALNHLTSDTMNIVTVEDPIEYQLAGINQVQVDERAGVTFASALRSILRQDPNVIMLGEVRDQETAQIAVRASLTGHLVLATLHTNDAASAPARLIDMGIEPFLLGASLIGVLAQRLVRRLCPECSQATHQPVGCRHCNMTGYSGRMGVFELLTTEGEVRELIHRNADGHEIEAAAANFGFQTMEEDAWEKVRMGLTTPEQVLGVIGGKAPEELYTSFAASSPSPTLADADAARLLDEASEDDEFSLGYASPEDDFTPSPIRMPGGLDSPDSTLLNAIRPSNAPSYPMIRLQIDTDSVRLVALDERRVYAARTFRGGSDEWKRRFAEGVGVTADKVEPLLATFSLNGGSPFGYAFQTVIQPMAKILEETRMMFPPDERDRVKVWMDWEIDHLPGLLDAFHALSPDLDFHRLRDADPQLFSPMSS